MILCKGMIAVSDVLIGQSYFLRFDSKLWDAMQPYPPLGALYAAGYLRSQGYDVALFDAMLAQSETEWADALDRERPRFAVLYEDNFNYLSKMCLLRMRHAAFTMITMARERGCTVIVAGSDASDHADRYLTQGAHFVLIGEGEHTLGELMDELTGKRHIALDSILGLAFPGRANSDQVVRTPPRPDIKDLDALPFPAWNLVDIPRYREIWYGRHGYYSMNMVTTRGCPYHCNWCAKPIWGQRYNSRSPENVVEELRWLKTTFSPDHIWFVDDIMGLKPRWIDRFADLVSENHAKVPFKSLHRVDLLLRGETVASLARAGAKTVWVGAESGSQKILDAMDKGTKVEQIREAASRLQAAGIEVGFFLQFGYPGESREDIERTFQMVRDCDPDDIGASVSYPLPGTKFYETVKQSLGEKQNWVDSADLAMMYRGTFATEFYRQLHLVLHKEFVMRKGWKEMRRAIRRPWTLRRRHLRRSVGVAYRLITLPTARGKLERLATLPPAALHTLPAAGPASSGGELAG
jgi:anaerobic magnesium-protoporphyrin IX monomethyl ester cyclase